jgi:CRP-like cAMP-binding protein
MPTLQRKIVTRQIKAGEILLKPGAKIDSVYVIQAGRISLCQSKSGKMVEISQLRAPEAIADEAIFGTAPWQMMALAIRDTTVVEVSVEVLRGELAAANANLRALLKAMSDRTRAIFAELKTHQANREIVPCPADHTAKVFGVIYHTARAVGKSEEGKFVADWTAFRRYAFEVFDESVVRLEDAVNILIKLGYVRMQGASIHLNDMSQIEAFYDYYGNYHFKGGYDDLLKTNAKMQKLTEEFLKVAAEYPADRGGNAHLPYKATVDALKKTMGNSFEADQLFRLEQKGLFIKRVATNDGGTLSFYKPDFEQMLLNWKILRELELWNEKGFVENGAAAVTPAASEDPTAERKRWVQLLASWKPAAAAGGGAPKLRSGEKKVGEIWCDVCMSVMTRGQAICAVCGAEKAKKAS